MTGIGRKKKSVESFITKFYEKRQVGQTGRVFKGKTAMDTKQVSIKCSLQSIQAFY